MYTKLETDLRKSGYLYDGYFKEKPEALKRSKNQRLIGNKSRVIKVTHIGRIYNSVGYRVYTKFIVAK